MDQDDDDVAYWDDYADRVVAMRAQHDEIDLAYRAGLIDAQERARRLAELHGGGF